MKRWLLIYGPLAVGGIETLIVRLANYLASKGDEVAVLTSGGVNVPLLNSVVSPLIYRDRDHAQQLAVDWLERDQKKVAAISFDPISAALGLSIEVCSSASITHISGVYHPRAYFMDGERPDRKLLNKAVARSIGWQCLFFMNDECRREKERRWKVDLSASPIIPLPLEEKPRLWSRADGGLPLRMVSVGRLADFKQYNLGAPEVLKTLLLEGVDVTWDIYGSGELRAAILEKIAQYGLKDRLRLHGDLPYADLPAVLLDHDIFVGMGTAAAEAAMLGVPAIVVPDGERETSYGWFHQLPFGNVGELLQGRKPDIRIVDLIDDFLNQGRGSREALSAKLHESALPYAMPHIVGQLEAFVDSSPAATGRRLKRTVSTLYSLLTDSRLMRWVRRVRYAEPVSSSR